MNKRGQIYIIAALILSVVIFLLISQTNFVQRRLIEDDFEQLSKNFDMESAKFMNNLLAGGEIGISDVTSAFETFADKFSAYSWVENPDFEFIYVLDYGENRIFGNYMLEDLIVGETEIRGVGAIADTTICLDYCSTASIKQDVTPINVVSVSSIISKVPIKGMEYTFGIQEGPQIIVISREEKGDQVKVYMNEEFIEGKKVS